MRAFNAPKWSYKLKLNHRGVINDFFSLVLDIQDDTIKRDLMRLLDKYAKLKKEVFEQELEKLGLQQESSILHDFMSAKTVEDLQKGFVLLAGSESFTEFTTIMSNLVELWYESEIEFSGDLIRGFDYYDGIIFEVFDTNPENPRALYGWGRYNGLAKIFGVKDDIPAIGFAPGDETMKLFLEWHGLIENIQNTYATKYYLPLLDGIAFSEIQKVASILRLEWKDVSVWLSVKKLQKAVKYADKNNYSYVVILGEQEQEDNKYIVKNLKTGEEENISL